MREKIVIQAAGSNSLENNVEKMNCGQVISMLAELPSKLRKRIDRQINREADRHTDRQVSRHTNRQSTPRITSQGKDPSSK